METASKHAAARNAAGGAGGGKDGAKLREKAKASGSLKCKVCMTLQPNMISMKAHYDSKHAKIAYDDALIAEYEAMKNK